MKKVFKNKWITILLIVFAISATNANAQRGRRTQRTRTQTSRTTTTNTRTWTGAASVDELKRKIVGTSWYCKDRGTIIRQFTFSNGKVKMKSGMRGEWFDEHEFSSYNVRLHQTAEGNFVSVSFGDDESTIKYQYFSIAFIDKCKMATLFQHGNPIGNMTFGTFEWNEEL